MKIIDEKGRLFGKINVIDFLVILFLLSLTPMFYFGYKIFNKNPQQPQLPAESSSKKLIEIEESFIFTQLDAKTAEMVSSADKEIDSNGDIIGFIVSLGRRRPLIYEIDVGNGQTLTKEDPAMKEIPAILRLKVELRANTMYYKNKPIRVDSAIEFKSDKYAAQALLVPESIYSRDEKTKNEIKNILLPELERKIDNLQFEVNNLKEKMTAVEILLNQIGSISAQAPKQEKRKK